MPFTQDYHPENRELNMAQAAVNHSLANEELQGLTPALVMDIEHSFQIQNVSLY